LVNILILRLCNYDKSPDHVESAGKFTLKDALVKDGQMAIFRVKTLLKEGTKHVKVATSYVIPI
jgi:hypothetical protein